MSSHSALVVSGSVFAFVALMHLLRLIYKLPVVIAGKTIPLWVSGIGFILPLGLSIWMFSSSCSAMSLSQGDKMEFLLQSSAFQEGAAIPSKYTCHGEDISPPLNWRDEPQRTQSFVLIVDDPDAPAGIWNHWILFNIPQAIHELTENLISLPKGAQLGKNSWGKAAYGGPCPPSGEHRYVFTLYALDGTLNLPVGAAKSEIEAAMQGHVLAVAKLMGKYKK